MTEKSAIERFALKPSFRSQSSPQPFKEAFLFVLWAVGKKSCFFLNPVGFFWLQYLERPLEKNRHAASLPGWYQFLEDIHGVDAELRILGLTVSHEIKSAGESVEAFVTSCFNPPRDLSRECLFIER